MKSNILSGSLGIGQILDEVERTGEYCKLTPNDIMKLRLLAEEMMGLTVRLFDKLEYEFHIESDGNQYCLVLSAKTLVSPEQKEKMLSLAADGKNAAAKGVLGKLSSVFQDMLIAGNDPDMQIPPTFGGVGYTMGYTTGTTMGYSPFSGMEYSAMFSMSTYRTELPSKDKDEEWDGLEKSIIASIANDVVIGVKSGKVEMTAVIELGSRE